PQGVRPRVAENRRRWRHAERSVWHSLKRTSQGGVLNEEHQQQRSDGEKGGTTWFSHKTAVSIVFLAKDRPAPIPKQPATSILPCHTNLRPAIAKIYNICSMI